jgi:hypothetical protein
MAAPSDIFSALTPAMIWLGRATPVHTIQIVLRLGTRHLTFVRMAMTHIFLVIDSKVFLHTQNINTITMNVQ